VIDVPSGDSELQSQRETLSSLVGAFFAEQHADAEDAVCFGATFLVEQQDFSTCGADSRRQQHDPDSRLVSEQRHWEPGLRTQLVPPNGARLSGNPSEVTVNHTAQKSRAARQLKTRRANDRAVSVPRNHRMMLLNVSASGRDDTRALREHNAADVEGTHVPKSGKHPLRNWQANGRQLSDGFPRSS
jgi:hypothetical protein